MTYNFNNVLMLVLFSCIITASSRILLKKGLIYSNAMTGMVYSLLFGWIVLTTLFLIDYQNQKFSTPGVLFFAGIGIIAPPIVRYLTYIGVEKLGASRSDPIRSLTPLFAVIFAFIFFYERFNPSSLFACIFILIGTYILSKDSALHLEGKKMFSAKDLFYPLIAAVMAGLVSNLRKIGMNLDISSLAAATTAATSAIFVFSLFLFYKNNYKRIIFTKSSIKYLFFTGILVSITDVIDLIALKNSKVSTVAPLLASTPLFVIVFSAIFLQGIEKITKNLVFGTLLIFAGILTITLTRV